MLQSWEELPPYFISSATDKTGKKEILEFISNINTNLDKN